MTKPNRAEASEPRGAVGKVVGEVVAVAVMRSHYRPELPRGSGLVSLNPTASLSAVGVAGAQFSDTDRCVSKNCYAPSKGNGLHYTEPYTVGVAGIR